MYPFILISTSRVTQPWTLQVAAVTTWEGQTLARGEAWKGREAGVEASLGTMRREDKEEARLKEDKERGKIEVLRVAL